MQPLHQCLQVFISIQITSTNIDCVTVNKPKCGLEQQLASQRWAQLNRSSVGISIEVASPASSVQLWKGKSVAASTNFASRTLDANWSLLHIWQFSSFLCTSSGELFCTRWQWRRTISASISRSCEKLIFFYRYRICFCPWTPMSPVDWKEKRMDSSNTMHVNTSAMVIVDELQKCDGRCHKFQLSILVYTTYIRSGYSNFYLPPRKWIHPPIHNKSRYDTSDGVVPGTWYHT